MSLFTKISFLILCFWVSLASAESVDAAKKVGSPDGLEFISDGERGWFWYETEPEPEPEPEIEEPIPSPPPVAEVKPSEPEDLGPAPLSTAWIRENLDSFKDRAIDSENEDDVRAYLYLQRVAMDKAERFANVYQKVVQGDPILDETNRYPTSTFAANEFDEAAATKRSNLLKGLAEKAGIFFFFGKDCEVCQRQAWILSQLNKRHSIEVLPISVDGAEIDEEFFGPAKRDSGQFELVGASQIPAIVLANPPEAYRVIGQGGGYSLIDLERRVLSTASYMGLISDEEFDSTKAVKGGLMLTDTKRIDPSEIDPDDPVKLVEQIRSLTPLGDGL